MNRSKCSRTVNTREQCEHREQHEQYEQYEHREQCKQHEQRIQIHSTEIHWSK